MRLPAIAAAFALFGTAEAALIQYEVTLFNEFGVENGTGLVSYNPEIQTDIFLGDFGPCTPSGPDDPACRFQVTWTPLAFSLTIEGVSIVLENQYLEGHYQPFTRGLDPAGVINPNSWGFTSTSSGAATGILFFPADFTRTIAYELSNGDFGLPGRDEFDTFTGSATFARVGEIPVPGAAWVFIAGLGALAAQRGRLLSRNRSKR